ncbi:MAG: hydroxymethylbilane synthase [Oscillospiraceae bacterium]|nr:hydroxymethylbilane synthase [Oscillospiraceae bacterium]
MKIRVGSRESRLAVLQAELLVEAVRAARPDIEWEIVTMKTTGDRILDRTLDKIGGKGLFVRELDQALREGRVDVTVHSCKDLPMEEDPELPIAAFSRREDPRDALILPEGAAELDFSRPIGCASLRRKIQLQKLFPQASIEPVRGNVLTRLEKLDGGQFSALVLAAAGLKRLGLEGRISRIFSADELLPAAGQGILAAQVRSGEDASWLAPFADRESGVRARGERSFVKALDGGCSSPIAAFAVVEGEALPLTGMGAGGEKSALTGPAGQPEELGRALAERMRKEGLA